MRKNTMKKGKSLLGVAVLLLLAFAIVYGLVYYRIETSWKVRQYIIPEELSLEIPTFYKGFNATSGNEDFGNKSAYHTFESAKNFTVQLITEGLSDAYNYFNVTLNFYGIGSVTVTMTEPIKQIEIGAGLTDNIGITVDFDVKELNQGERSGTATIYISV